MDIKAKSIKDHDTLLAGTYNFNKLMESKLQKVKKQQQLMQNRRKKQRKKTTFKEWSSNIQRNIKIIKFNISKFIPKISSLITLKHLYSESIKKKLKMEANS